MERMKQTGIQWIGAIPITWTVNKLKYVATETDSLFLDGDWIESDVLEDEGIRYFTTGNVGTGFFKEQGDGYISEKTFNALHCLKVFPGDIMISRLNEPIGRSCIVPAGEDYYVVAVDNVVLRPDSNYDKRYLVYAMNCDGYAEHGNLIARGATMHRVSRSQLGQFWIPVPEKEEQERIADYLDDKCKRIEGVLKTLEEQIECLINYKKSLVIEATTKGIDKTTKLIESGNLQIGKMPSHWCVLRGKYVFKEYGGSIKDEDLSDTEVTGWKKVIYFKVDDMNRTEHGFEMVYDIDDIYTRKSYRELPAPLILVPKRGAAIYTNKVRITNRDCLIDPNVMAISVKGNIEFYAYYLYGRTLADIGDVSTIPQINNKHIDNLLVPVPPEEEQNEIVCFLNGRCNRIDELIDKKTAQLEKLKEYKKSLIFEYVTGKKRV